MMDWGGRGMLERDYLMRLLKGFIDAIGKIAKLKQEKQFEQALSLVDEQLSMLLRLRAKHVNSLSEDDLLKLMTTYGKLEGEKVLMVAALTEDQADVYELMGNEAEPYRLRLRALRLYLHAAPTLADGEVVDYAARIEALLGMLMKYRLPANTCLLMMQYEESAGRYARAEDWLYRLAEAAGGKGEGSAGGANDVSGGGGVQIESSETDTLLSVGEQFYDRLSGLDDDRLEQGNFSREEVEAGLEDWRANF
jgi:hypothetical protein